ncbi:2OG-Fe dioxygenase family protein [Sphaerisporangium sp. TRM90804]|uniref:2OG-Fe dioxygenase family protein n=1 Tax=Sphaerisporangium sp. TRM90804 TaxID=3031113 RepID=UPI00244D6BE0|nr:2OG-Fe dioxygenase family protein [Sphaerisporangium sp. TRM90804]MDH2428332.1 hypothetical protein [Sphaerisporangium sp. TRM90804]
MSSVERGFAFTELSPVPPAILNGYRDRPVVERGGGVLRYRRSVRFRMSWTADDDWYVAPCADPSGPRDGAHPSPGPRCRVHGPLCRGRLARGRLGTCLPAPEPGADLVPLLRRGLDGLWLDVSTDWLIDVEQSRTVVTAGAAQGMEVYTPGADGWEFVLVAVLRGSGVTGGRTLLHGTGEVAPLWAGVLRPGQALLADRRVAACRVAEPVAGAVGLGSQDVLVAALTRWTTGAAAPALTRPITVPAGPPGGAAPGRPVAVPTGQASGAVGQPVAVPAGQASGVAVAQPVAAQAREATALPVRQAVAVPPGQATGVPVGSIAENPV